MGGEQLAEQQVTWVRVSKVPMGVVGLLDLMRFAGSYLWQSGAIGKWGSLPQSSNCTPLHEHLCNLSDEVDFCST